MLKNIGQYNKAFVPIVVALFALLSDRFGVQLGIGEAEAVGIIALFSSLLVYIIPNKTPSEVTVSVPTETKVVVPTEKIVEVKEQVEKSVAETVEAKVLPSILRTVSK